MAARNLVSRLSPFIGASRTSSLHRLRPLIGAGEAVLWRRAAASVSGGGMRSFSTRPTTTSLNDPSPNWSNRPPKETILLDGCDFEHWLVVVEPPDANLTRDEIIDSYIKTLAQVVGSEQEARMKIYSVSTKHYFAFGALVSEELSYKIKVLPNVRWVLPDSYLDVKNKDYGGEPFIDGEAVPYDPKYHEEWVRNHTRANERSRRNDRPRNFDRSRNFERRRENMQSRDAPPAPMHNQPFQSGPTQPPPSQPPPQSAAAPPPPPNQFGHMPSSNVPPTQPSASAGYQTQMPNPSYQAGNQARQGPGGGPGAYPGNGYQGGNQGYQSGGPAYSGGNPGYQNPGPGYHGGSPSYPSGNGYQGGSTSGYHQPYNGGNSTGYQPPAYQAGTQTNYQPSAYQGGNQTNYQPGNLPRDIPGRD